MSYTSGCIDGQQHFVTNGFLPVTDDRIGVRYSTAGSSLLRVVVPATQFFPTDSPL